MVLFHRSVRSVRDLPCHFPKILVSSPALLRSSQNFRQNVNGSLDAIGNFVSTEKCRSIFSWQFHWFLTGWFGKMESTLYEHFSGSNFESLEGLVPWIEVPQRRGIIVLLPLSPPPLPLPFIHIRSVFTTCCLTQSQNSYSGQLIENQSIKLINEILSHKMKSASSTRTSAQWVSSKEGINNRQQQQLYWYPTVWNTVQSAPNNHSG